MDSDKIKDGVSTINNAMNMISDLLPIMEENMQKYELIKAHQKAEQLLNELKHGNKDN
jgi:hypothetical protein